MRSDCCNATNTAVWPVRLDMGLSDKDTLAKIQASSVHHHGSLTRAQDAEWLKAKREEDEEERGASLFREYQSQYPWDKCF